MTSKNEKDTFIPTEIFDAIENAETVVITAHEFPDGDAV
jgi:nanoRNase/pAp phosphatase (c-di-AMP/oligoRNAs hydrolase)